MDFETFNKIGVSIVDALIAAKFVRSKREAREKIRAGAVRLEGTRVTDEQSRLAYVGNTFLLLTMKNPEGTCN
jgi:tyrosyl-tRNA synthetase